MDDYYIALLLTKYYKYKKERDVLAENKAKCLCCGDVIESKYTHDFVTCSCGRLSVDGGLSYERRVFVNKDEYEELSVYTTGEKVE